MAEGYRSMATYLMAAGDRGTPGLVTSCCFPCYPSLVDNVFCVHYEKLLGISQSNQADNKTNHPTGNGFDSLLLDAASGWCSQGQIYPRGFQDEK